MYIEKKQIGGKESEAFYTAYFLNDSKELLPGKKRPVIIIAPGGGYLFTSDREAEPIAMKFLSLGYHAVILRYTTGNQDGTRVGVADTALRELALTVCDLKQNHDKWRIDENKIGICGFSAGAHLAASLGVHWQDQHLVDSIKEANGDSCLLKPNALILGYGLFDYQIMKDRSLALKNDETVKDNLAFMEKANLALTGEMELTKEVILKYSPSKWVSDQTPPAFLWHTAKDRLVYSENSLVFALELANHQIPYEIHIFQEGEHGLSLATEVTANNQDQIDDDCAIWFHLATQWLKKNLPFS
ncbi:alpha/beta hydrolase [Clostridium sp. E02]|uniref:alpha/beta hydrolase n=1 Tax=Clostridium sp. E02 TaxID=2487134 RepID=UPI000F52F110|nr:alpha/beta hydrolase [Clostridium sp. E02]